MTLCYDCRQGVAEIAEHGEPRWHYATVESPCDNCDSAFSHERVYGPEPEEVR